MRPKPPAAAKSGPRKRRRWFLWLSVLLGFLAGAYFFFQYQVVDTQLKPLIESKLTEAVHSDVSIQSVRAGLTGNVVLNHVSLTVPGHPWESRVQVDQISVNVELINLLFHRKPLENCLDSLSFVRPQIVLVKNEVPSASVSGGTVTLAPPPVMAPIPIFPVPHVSIREGRFSIQAEKSPREVLRDLNFNATTTNGTAWGLSFSAHSPEADSQGVIRFDGGFQPENLKLRGVVNLQQWPLASMGSTLKETTGWELSAGTIDAESPVVFQQGRSIWYDAKAEVFQGTLKTPGPVLITFSNISGRAILRPTEINIPTGISYQVGETQWKAAGLVPLDGRPLSVHSSTDQLYLSTVINDIFKLNQIKTEGTGSATLSVTGPLQDPVVTGNASLGASKLNQWPVDSFEVKGHFEKQILYFESVEGKLMGGSFTADGLISLLNQPDAPVSLRVNLVDVAANKAASILGISQTQGTINEELHYGGTREKYVFSTTGEMDLTRTLRDSVVQYRIRHSAQLKDGKLLVSATLNEKSRLEAAFTEEPEDWKLEKFSISSGKRQGPGKWSGKGILPKADDKPIQIEISGQGASLEEAQFFHDQFPDISGNVNINVKVGGTKKDPVSTATLSSNAVTIKASEGASVKGLEPQPLIANLTWKPGELHFDQLQIGNIFSASGQLGFSPQSPLDLKIKADGFPMPLIAEITQWNNPPQPFEGFITGHLHLSGLMKNPIVEGDDIAINDLNIGDWHADQVNASLNMVEGKLLVKKLKLQQAENFLAITGSWDTRPQSGLMALHFSSRGFQLGRGPFLTGEFSLDAKSTGDPFWANWDGNFSTPAFTLKDLKGNVYSFDDFSMAANCEDLVLDGEFKLGKNISGSAVLDASEPKTTLKGIFKIAPSLLTEVPELTQFLPKSMKMSGTISGELKLKKGTFDELPMAGSFTVTDGVIQKYNFDRMEFSFEGNKSKIDPKFSLVRGQANYTLSGTLESPKAFWDSDSEININGPVEREKLGNILALMGIDTEKHQVGGEVNGNLSVAGPFSAPVADFTVTGENLRYDNNIVLEARLHFAYSSGKISMEKDNKITLPKGKIDIEQGSAYLDAQDPTIAVLDLSGSTQDLPIGFLHFTSQIHMSGRLALEEKESRPTFDGLLSVIETGSNTKQPTPFDLALSVHNKVIEFKPLDNSNPQLVGKVDLSLGQRVLFNNLHLVNTTGLFSVDGALDLNGPCSLVSDSKNVPIQEIGKWILPNFPLKGTGSYHLVFEGTLAEPIFTASLSIMDGQVGDLQFDLLDGELKESDNTLFLGDEENPITLSRQGIFTFTLAGKMPLALTEEGMKKVRNREMDITAKMEKGDFSLILLAGWAKKASGNMDFSAHIGGTLDNPDVTMDLDLAKCQLVPPMVAQSIDDLNGRIKVRHNHLAVEDLNARIGQGRVFITSPPVEESKMVLVDFIPQYLDFRVQTIGSHGLWLSIPTLMDKGEWGEIYFYGATPNDPLLIQGPLNEPSVIGTALLDTGHYTFPPKEATDESGQKIEYRELANVNFDLNLASGKDTWYSNDFNTQYLELKVDPGDKIHIFGKDADRGTEQGGIKCVGNASSKHGWLRYLGHEFEMQDASLSIAKMQLPRMQGYATDVFHGINVLTAGGVRQTDATVRVDFNGTFGDIDFKLSSQPTFAPASEGDAAQNILLSYIMFGTDMTGLTTGNSTESPDQLKSAYQQRVGQVVNQAALDAIDRITSSSLTGIARPWAQRVLNTEVNIKTNIASTGPNAFPTPGGLSAGPDALGNSLAGAAVPVVQLQFRKSLDPRLSVLYNVGVTRDLATENLGMQNQLGLQYDLSKNLSLNAITGPNDIGQSETKVMAQFSEPLPDIMKAKPGDKERPKFVRLNCDSFGPGKFHIAWETDKVTRCEVRVLDSDGQVVQDNVEKQQHAYDHEVDIEGLDPTADYKLQISAKDLNQNERIETRKLPASAG